MNIYEVLEFGPVVAHNEELGILITVNGSYFNVWCMESHTQWTNTTCRPVDNGMDGLYTLKIVDLMKRAEEYLEEIINEGNEA